MRAKRKNSGAIRKKIAFTGILASAAKICHEVLFGGRWTIGANIGQLNRQQRTSARPSGMATRAFVLRALPITDHDARDGRQEEKFSHKEHKITKKYHLPQFQPGQDIELSIG